MDTSFPVAIAECSSYGMDTIRDCLTRMFVALDIAKESFAGKRICLKPNLVMAKKPEAAATTHPVLLAALASLLMEWGAASVTVIDSPGGPYTGANLAIVYKTCGLTMLEKIPGVMLNQDFSFRQVSLPDGNVLKKCAFLQPVLECDMFINVCKLKTHGLTGLSGAVKNLFGLVPGVEKFAMHATYPKIREFSGMLVDINEFFRGHTEYLSICDGIVGMEGNGPTHGNPVASKVLLASRSPYGLDVVAEHIIGCKVPVVYLDEAAARGLCPRDWRQISLVGQGWEQIPELTFTPPEATASRFLRNLSGIWGGRLAEIFAARPKIQQNCVGCGVCVRSCPAHTITLRKTKSGHKAVIAVNDCIRCYCCQELCPHDAVKITGNPLVKWIH